METSQPRLDSRPPSSCAPLPNAPYKRGSSLGPPAPLHAATNPERELKVDRALRMSNADGCLYALMLGASESYFGAMAVELGHRDTSLAFLLTVPMLFGSAAQLLAGPLTALLGARKRLVVAGATLQTFSMLGMYLIAAQGVRSF